MTDSNTEIEPPEEIPLNLTLKDKTYSYLKFIALVVMPAMALLYLVLAGVWNLLQPEIVVATILVANLLLGVLLGMSSRQYQTATQGEFVGFLNVTKHQDGKKTVELEFPGDPHDIDKHDRVTFKVRKESL